MQVLKYLHLFLAFMLELIMVAAFGYWGVKSSQSPLMRWIAGIGLPLLAVILWGLFAAPKSTYRLPLLPQILFSLTLFCLAGYALYQTGHKTMAALFVSAAIISSLVAYYSER